VLLCDPDFQAVARLWNEVSEFPAARPEAALDHYLGGIASLAGARDAFWVGATRETKPSADDPLLGWRVGAVRHLQKDEQRARVVTVVLQQMKKNVVDPMTQAVSARAGATRAHLRPELVDDAVWTRSWLYNDLLRPLKVDDRLLGACAVDRKTESYVGLDRGPRERPFGQRERDLLQFALLGGVRFHRNLLRAHGLTGCSPRLTLREQQVLRLLLTDRAEKQIAAALGLTPRSTHQYVVSILRKFGVKGRVGLMALWLGHDRPWIAGTEENPIQTQSRGARGHALRKTF
jgi:DNA-binding CsgD family transcriptional regulator